MRCTLSGESLQTKMLSQAKRWLSIKSRLASPQARATSISARDLLKVGVAVLTKGEIEDYFPIECLAEIAGCSQQEAQDAIARRRTEFEEPTAMQLVQTVILNKQAICESNEDSTAKTNPALVQPIGTAFTRGRCGGAGRTQNRRRADTMAENGKA